MKTWWCLESIGRTGIFIYVVAGSSSTISGDIEFCLDSEGCGISSRLLCREAFLCKALAERERNVGSSGWSLGEFLFFNANSLLVSTKRKRLEKRLENGEEDVRKIIELRQRKLVGGEANVEK